MKIAMEKLLGTVLGASRELRASAPRLRRLFVGSAQVAPRLGEGFSTQVNGGEFCIFRRLRHQTNPFMIRRILSWLDDFGVRNDGCAGLWRKG